MYRFVALVAVVSHMMGGIGGLPGRDDIAFPPFGPSVAMAQVATLESNTTIGSGGVTRSATVTVEGEGYAVAVTTDSEGGLMACLTIGGESLNGGVEVSEDGKPKLVLRSAAGEVRLKGDGITISIGDALEVDLADVRASRFPDLGLSRGTAGRGLPVTVVNDRPVVLKSSDGTDQDVVTEPTYLKQWRPRDVAVPADRGVITFNLGLPLEDNDSLVQSVCMDCHRTFPGDDKSDELSVKAGHTLSPVYAGIMRANSTSLSIRDKQAMIWSLEQGAHAEQATLDGAQFHMTYRPSEAVRNWRMPDGTPFAGRKLLLDASAVVGADHNRVVFIDEFGEGLVAMTGINERTLEWKPISAALHGELVARRLFADRGRVGTELAGAPIKIVVRPNLYRASGGHSIYEDRARSLAEWLLRRIDRSRRPSLHDARSITLEFEPQTDAGAEYRLTVIDKDGKTHLYKGVM